MTYQIIKKSQVDSLGIITALGILGVQCSVNMIGYLIIFRDPYKDVLGSEAAF